MSAGREVLKGFQDNRVCPKPTYDLHAASARAVACHSYCSRPGVGNEVLKSAGEPGSHHVLGRQQRQDGEEDDAAPGEDAKGGREEVSAHRVWLSTVMEWQGHCPYMGALSPASRGFDAAGRGGSGFDQVARGTARNRCWRGANATGTHHGRAAAFREGAAPDGGNLGAAPDAGLARPDQRSQARFDPTDRRSRKCQQRMASPLRDHRPHDFWGRHSDGTKDAIPCFRVGRCEGTLDSAPSRRLAG
jgi:hypothetical protein